ncbi:hypothetical protein [Streptomyces sp. NPDC048002]|uniref:hypothetical protein n=1 Tax=unclassified Streptomyces TaxID=2593676 RepID=UPI0033FF042C
MRILLEAAIGLPGLLFTAALAVVLCFWLLVVLGVAGVDGFDRDADLTAWGMGGVPVAVAASLLTVVAWALGVGVTVLLTRLSADGVLWGLLRSLAWPGSLFAAWRLTCLFVRPLHRLFPDEPAPVRPRTHDRAA